jgi:hypothetical protein
MKTWYPTYVSPFYCRNGRYASAEDWRALHRLNTQGHQDTKKLIRALTAEEHLNVVADKLIHRARALPDQKTYYPFPSNPVSFKINNKYINSNHPRVVNSAFHNIAL